MIAALLEFIVILIVCAAALAAGILFFLFACALLGSRDREDRAQELASEYATRHIGRNAYLIRELYRIGPPDLPSGHYSEEKQLQWAYFKQLEKEHEYLTKQERDHLLAVEFGEER